MTPDDLMKRTFGPLADLAPLEHDPILLTDRDFQLFEELMARAVEPNDLVRSEAEDFNRVHFDEQGRCHWS